MKKVLCLSLLSFSLYSMQLVTINQKSSKAQIIQQKIQQKLHHDGCTHKELRRKSTPESNRFELIQVDNEKNIKQLISSSVVYASQQLGDVKLFHDGKLFHVLHNGETKKVQPAFTDKIVRKATTLEMKDFQKVGKGYLHITQMANGQFEIKVEDRLVGGGPIAGKIAYWTTKILCYGVIAAVAIGAAANGKAAIQDVISSTPADINMNTLKGMSEGAIRQIGRDNLAAIADNIENATKLGIWYCASNATVPLAAETVAETVTSNIVRLTPDMIAVASEGARIIPETASRIISTAPSGLPPAAGYAIIQVGNAIRGAGLEKTAEAAFVSGAISTAGTGYGITASIEALSLSIGIFFGLTPTP